MLEFLHENFIEVWNYDFYQRAIIASLLVSIVTGLVSVVIVNKNWSMLGMGLSNSVFPGVVAGSQFHFPMALTIGAFSTGLLCFYLTTFIIYNSKIKNDAALGMCYSSFFALGLLMLGFFTTQSHITHILFGDLLGIPDAEFTELIIITVLVVAIFMVKFRDIILFTFDEIQFQIQGLSYRWFYNMMLFIITLTIIASLQAIGILLTIAYLVLPTVTAQLISKKITKVVLLSIAVNLISSYFGITFSYIEDISTGPSIVVVQTILFLLAFMWRKYSNYRTKQQFSTQALNSSAQ